MKPKVDFDEYADSYQEILTKQLKFFDNASYFSEYKVKIINAQKIRKPGRILEYGCGVGKNIPFLQRFFSDAAIYGCDISAQSLELASAENPVATFFNNDKEKITLQFDLIFVSGVMHHVQPHQRVAVIQELERLLAPQGELFIFEHNPYNPVTRHMVNHCEFDEDAILLKPNEMRFLVENAQLAVHKLHYTLFMPGFLKALRFLEPYLRHIPMGGQYYIHASKKTQL